MTSNQRWCAKHGPHDPGACPECDALAEARSIVATTLIPPAEQRPSNDWMSYERFGSIEARPYADGDQADLYISFGLADLNRTSLDGGMIARNPANTKDQWYIAPDYFAKHYRATSEPAATRKPDKFDMAFEIMRQLEAEDMETMQSCQFGYVMRVTRERAPSPPSDALALLREWLCASDNFDMDAWNRKVRDLVEDAPQFFRNEDGDIDFGSVATERLSGSAEPAGDAAAAAGAESTAALSRNTPTKESTQGPPYCTHSFISNICPQCELKRLKFAPPADKCFEDCGDDCQCEKHPPQYCKGCSNTVDQCTCTAGETGAVQDTDKLAWCVQVHEDLAELVSADGGNMLHVRAHRALGIMFDELQKVEKVAYPALSQPPQTEASVCEHDWDSLGIPQGVYRCTKCSEIQ